MIETTIEQRLKTFLHEQNISQVELAAALEVSKQLVNVWLSGDKPLAPKHALTIIKKLDVFPSGSQRKALCI